MKIEYDNINVFGSPFRLTKQFFRRDRVPFPWHSHDFYEFFLVVSGQIRHHFNGRDIELPAGSLQLIRPNDSHRLFCSDKSYEAVIYNCDIAKDEFIPVFCFLTDSRQCSIDDLPQAINLKKSVKFDSLVEKLESIFSAQHNLGFPLYLRNALGRSVLQEILCLFLEKTISEEKSVPEWLEKVFLEMRKPENFLAGLPLMVKLSGRSQEHLCRSMRLHYGISPREYILDLRLHMAIELLGNPELSITEAALRSGFNNLSYFRKCFCDHFGITPRLYRKRYEIN